MSTGERARPGFLKRTFQHRLLVLLGVLLVVALWYAHVRLDEGRPVSWSQTHRVLVCPLVPEAADSDALRERIAAAGEALDAWALEQQRPWLGESAPVALRFDVAEPQPVIGTPPRLPEPDAAFSTRWRSVRDFLGWFEQQDARFEEPWPDASRIYLLVYTPAEAWLYEDRHSVGTKRGRRGFVFASSDANRWGNALAVLVHETISHTVGAVEHRTPDARIAWPDGYAEPERQPLHPQKKAEIMALGIPIDGEREYRVTSLDDIVIGEATAREIGWLMYDE